MEIYVVKISDIYEEKINRLSLLISSEKKDRINKFIHKKDKIRALIGEILIRSIINAKFNLINKYIIFSKNEYGKPYLKCYPDFKFNISHSGEFVVCAIDNKDIGIDIEYIKNIEYKEIAKKFFSENEFEYIIKNNIDIQLNKFYEIWTLKESYIKCCGQGLSIPLESFSINIDTYNNINVNINNKTDTHIFTTLYVESDYKMSVCSVNTKITKNITRVDQDELIDNYFEMQKSQLFKS
ncbi:4'-phosphopantetheinyl transferase family protein [Clostridium beijerinckii]|uniref:4'-phosphopantetheinyl transferase n=1 Tax=Clostridium beijerinckii TaxID=1520 RepID=A0AAE5H291_CLOBE|nr:4'-phosphopantetheinyl transferase superfamily protein [Clostridium beijerinckii]NSB12641.1 4'-phosphopantetheinyl transferase [Clostridium beijerinckii]OOM20126.1 4'-phosphopantetheinyl transferase sfp [Clostridium beijerinckii]